MAYQMAATAMTLDDLQGHSRQETTDKRTVYARNSESG